MVIKSCPLLMKDTETCVGSSLASYFVLFSLISFCFRWFPFISFSFRWFRFVFVDFVSFRFVFVEFRFYFVSHLIGTLYIMLNFVGQHHTSWIVYTSINNNDYFPRMYALCKHTISLTNFTSFSICRWNIKFSHV